MISPSLEQLSMSVEDVVTLCLKTLRLSLVGDQANRIAHTLVQEVIFLVNPQYFNDIPPCIWTLISNEQL